MTEKKDKIRATLITIVFHLLLLLVLVFLGLSTPLPLPEEEGVEVNLGFSAVGSGQNQSYKPLEQPKTPPPPPPSSMETSKEIEEEIVEQDMDEAPAIQDKVEEKPKQENIEKSKEELPKDIPVDEPVEQKIEPEPEPEPVIDQRLMYSGKKTNKGTSSEGPDDMLGDKGKAEGDIKSDNYDGLGGFGDGISFSLGNRKAKALPKPTYDSKDQGTVVVNIWVNKYGAVTRAVIKQKGTSVTDAKLWEMAMKAARKARFTADLDAPEEQKGSITYHFIKIN